MRFFGWHFFLVVATIGSALMVVLVTYQTRVQFSELEALRQTERELDEHWGRLLLEESAFSSPARVERVARNELGLSEPTVDQVRWLAAPARAE